ncbi:trypco2 family protein [Nonomuraea rubra]
MDVELARAVEGLRDELLAAAVAGAGSQIAFVVGPIELEFAVELKADARAKAGFKAWVITAGAEAGVSRGRTHKVKVTLTPKHPDGSDVLIAGTADQAAAGPGDVSGHLEP